MSAPSDGARADARKRLAAEEVAPVADVESLAAILWQADLEASPSGAGFGPTMAEDPCNCAYRSQARYALASDWLAGVIADAKAEAWDWGYHAGLDHGRGGARLVDESGETVDCNPYRSESGR